MSLGHARRTLGILLAVGLLAVPARAADRAGSATVTIRLIATNGSVRVVTDRAPKGKPSKGDVLRETTTLRNAVRQFGKPKNAVVGSDDAVYTLVSPTQANARITVKLPGGTLRGTARVVGSALPTIRVVGGTGTFASARGTGEIRRAPAGVNGVLNVYRLQLP